MRVSSLALCALALAFYSTNAAAAEFRVGPDANCTHNNIQSAIDAALANGPGADAIYIARNQIYTAQELSIEGHNVDLYGGSPTCGTTATDEELSVIDGSGGTANSVISVNQISTATMRVNFQNIEIRGGENGGDGQGGGIDAGPGSTIGLERTRVVANAATHGGGIYLSGSGAAAVELYLGTGSVIELNQASGDGGGIACEAPLNSVVFPFSGAIRQNSAARGGGVFLTSGCSLISYAGGSTGGIVNNQASGNGGGIYAEAQAYLFFDYKPAEGHGPVIAGNSAGNDGGGVFLTNASTFIAYEITLRDNQAGRHGGGVFATNAASFRMQRDGALGYCPDHARCNRLSGNLAGVSAVLPAGSGGALYVAAGASATVRQAYVTGNSADLDAAISSNGSGSLALLEGTVISGNSTADPASGVVGATNGGALSIAFSTLSGNSFPTAAVNANGGNTFLASSIVRETQGLVFAGTPAILADCAMLHETSSVPASPRVVVGDPLFVNAATGDYHLRLASSAHDFCDDSWAPQIADIDRVSRGYDDPERANLHGPYDLGGFESDRIFADGVDFQRY